MSSVWYGLSMVGIALIIYWFIKNDDMPNDRPTTGLFAMKMPSDVRIRRRTKRRPFSLNDVR